MFMTNNIIPDYNLEVSAFMFPIGGVVTKTSR